ncbi:MAG: hypothetical protein KAW84_02580 [Thermoplasmata archaeon]|nr:hypothetical protein [Thermoplasmata archaeon]
MNIGVFVCGYSGNISNYIDTGKVAKEAGNLDDVSYVGKRDASVYFCARSMCFQVCAPLVKTSLSLLFRCWRFQDNTA